MDTRFRNKVQEATDHAALVAFDGCHKIYIALDQKEARWYLDNEWKTFIGPADAMTDQVCQWYEDSCSLRFIDATSTSQNSTETEHYSDFLRVIPQGARASNRWEGED